MRFHIGFSKFLKPSQVIKWLGVGFVGFLTWFGLTQQQVLASSTFTNVNLQSYISGYHYIGVSKTGYSRPLDTNVNENRTTTFSSYHASMSDLNMYANSSYWYVYDNVSYEISTNMCSGVSDTNSLDLFFNPKGRSLTYLNQGLTAGGFTNAESISDIVSIGIQPIYSQNNEPPVIYSCHINEYTANPQYDGTWGTWDVSCIGIPTDDVLGYKIYYYNELYKNFNLTQLNKTSGSWFGQPIYTINSLYDYQCSYVEPVQPDEPLFPEDIIGESNIIITDNSGSSGGVSFDSNGSIDYSFIQLAYPNTLTQFIEFPLYLANAVVNNHDTCTPIQIDFSSLTRRFGGSNYVLTLPCLYTTISTTFGIKVIGNTTLYDLIDMFIAFCLLYMFATRMIVLVNMMISGQDLTGYLFSGTSQVVGADEKTGEVITKRRRY